MLGSAQGIGLEIRECSKSYGETRALDRVSFTVPPGRVVALVGANGAGKTTLLHALVGLIRLESGTMALDGVPAAAVAAKRRTSFMPDDLPRPLRLTGRELVEFNCRLYQCPVPDLEEWARRLDLTSRLDHPLGGYSHGMRRKADLLAALAVAPDLLVLDEPFSGLDPSMVAQLQKILRDLRDAGVAVLVSSHDLELVEELADEIVVLDRGQVVARGSGRAIAAEFGSTDLRSAFLTMIKE